MKALKLWLTGVLLVAAAASSGWAQTSTNGAIAGVVRDTTGAVLPGVTVEVASPALIEKVRTAVTDGGGNYKITDLRPGTYTVTFSLTGFGSVRREGLELATGFTVPVNAELKVGSLEETVTVTGASPVVDTQNVRQTNVITQATLQALPTNKSLQAFATLTVGLTVDSGSLDVGGNRHEQGAVTMNGGPVMKTLQDGMVYNNLNGTGDGQQGSYAVNVTAMTEVALELAGIGAESKTGGVNMNFVPRDGGNEFSGLVDLNYGNGALQSSNLTDRFRTLGVRSAAEAIKLFDYSGGIGGPIARDRVWFFTAGRYNGSQEYSPSIFYNSVQGKYLGDPNSGVNAYVPDLTKRAFQDPHFRDLTGRLAIQASSKHKFTVNNSFQKSCVCNREVTGNVAPEAVVQADFNPVILTQMSWSNPATNKLLLDAGLSRLHDRNNLIRPDGTTANDIAIVEALGTATVPSGMRYGAKGNTTGIPAAFDYGYNLSKIWNGRAAMSYVPGAHSFKFGFQFLRGTSENENDYNVKQVAYTFRGGVPQSITQFAGPFYSLGSVREDGLFAQDQWTLRRLTLNLGVRYDYYTGHIPPQEKPAGPLAGAISVPEVTSAGLPRWHTTVPRIGAAYDLFGNSKTALKFNVGKYYNSAGMDTIQPYNRALAIATSATRAWTDANGNFVPDCDLRSVVANGECSVLSNARFGQPVATTLRDTALNDARGRFYNWQTTMGVQHQFLDGWGIDASYNRTWYGNFVVTDNRSITAADFDQYCVTVPTDARLPGGGGNQICGLYDLKPTKAGQVDNLITLQDNFGERTQVYNGVRISTNARFRKGIQVGGGVNVGRTRNVNCTLIDAPQTSTGPAAAGSVSPLDFCDTTTPWANSVQLKLNGVYPLPWWGVQLSAAFQAIPGIAINATRSFTNAEIAPSLGRNLTGAVSVNVPLYAPGTQLYEPYIKQLDLRVSKTVRFGGKRLEGALDVFNALNTAAALLNTATYGPAWQRPTSTLAGRTARFVGKFFF
jgi:hypothetical protein